jgi:flagellar hook protein FlgE
MSCCVPDQTFISARRLPRSLLTMSIFGAMYTAISGLNSQASAFGNISDNMANSQTTGYKQIDTTFEDYLTNSTLINNQSGSVAAHPYYENEVQGSIQQSTNPIALAITGQGFFNVAEEAGALDNGNPIFNTAQYYTRTGDFTTDEQGYLQNSAGEYLEGWAVNAATGDLNTSAIVPIQISQSEFAPSATANISLQANVPASPTATSNLTSEEQVYDATGTAHQLAFTWAQVSGSPNTWTVSFSSPDNVSGGVSTPAIGSATVTFNTNGTIASVSAPTGSVALGTSTTDADLVVSPDFGNTTQNITLNLGTINGSDGVTQYAGTDYTVQSITQDGVAPGSFTGITTSTEGDISANFNNGQSVRIARVPIATFANADALQRQNGQAFTADTASGAGETQSVNQNGAGGLVVGSTENSNVDIANQLADMIVTQQAYGANAKVITTANELLTTTLDMKQ